MSCTSLKRIMIVGNGCSGKSTLAERLGTILDTAVVHLDQFYWQPDGSKTNATKWQNLHNSLLQKDTWIIEGTQLSELDTRVAAADMIVFLQTHLFVCIFRAIKKYLQKDNRYGFPLQKKPISIVYWLIKFVFVHRQKVLQKINKHEKNVTFLKNKREIDQFLDNITRLATK